MKDFNLFKIWNKFWIVIIIGFLIILKIFKIKFRIVNNIAFFI